MFTADAVFGVALVADFMVAYCDLSRRECRCKKVKLTNRADELAEGRVLEETIDQQYREEVAGDNPRCEPR